MKSRLCVVCALLLAAGCQRATQKAETTEQRSPVTAQKQVVEEVQPEMAPPTWPVTARFARCSANGKTVVYMDRREIVVTRNGEELYRIKTIRSLDPDMAVNDDGSHVAIYSLAQNGVILWNVEERMQTRFIPLRSTARTIGFEAGELVFTFHFTDEEKKRYPVRTAEVHTTALCSDSGRIVAVVDEDHGIQLLEQGKETVKIDAQITNAELNRDGSRMLAYNKAQGVELYSTSNGKVLEQFDGTSDIVYHFSPGGGSFGVLEPGASALTVYNSGSGSHSADLPGRTWMTVDGLTRTHDYELAKFHWPNPESTDEDLRVNLVPIDKGFAIQWHLTRGYWEAQGMATPYASLDQSYHFNEDGTLSEYFNQ